VNKDRFARCTTDACPDGNGFFEGVGRYSVAAYFNQSRTTWTENFFDNNLEACALGVGECR